MNKALAFFAGIFAAIVFMLETHITTRDIFFNKISAKTKNINGNVSSDNINGLVYFKTNHTRFNTISDKDFKVSEICGELHRNVQYCQWQEVSEAHTKGNGSNSETYYTYTYHKGWVSSPINSLFFHDKKVHVNPYVDPIPDVTNREPIKAGAYTLDNTIELHGERKILSPRSQELMQFEKSDMRRAFEYAGRGIFYRSYRKGSLTNLLKIPTFFDTYNADNFDWCTPGDTRVWFTYWAPPKVTVIGEKNDNTITYKEIDEHKIGDAHSDDISLRDIVGANAPSSPTVWLWIMRIILVIIAICQYNTNINAFVWLVAMEFLLFCISHTNMCCVMIDRWFIKLSIILIIVIITYSYYYCDTKSKEKIIETKYRNIYKQEARRNGRMRYY